MKFILIRPGEKRALKAVIKALFVADILAMTAGGVWLAGETLNNGIKLEELRDEQRDDDNMDPTWEQIERYLRRDGSRGVEYDHYASYRRRSNDCRNES